MTITDSAISLNVADVEASSRWLQEHLGWSEVMSAEGFASLHHPEVGFNIALLRVGLETFKPASAAVPVNGLLIAFVVDDIEREYDRLRSEGVTVVTPLETEPWGERYFQMADPSGVIYQLVQWVEVPGGEEMLSQARTEG